MARKAYSKQKLEEIGLDAFHHLDREARTSYPRSNHHSYQKHKFVAEPQHPQTMFFATYQPPRAYFVQLNPETGKKVISTTAVRSEYDQPHYGDYPARKSTPMAAAAAAYY